MVTSSSPNFFFIHLPFIKRKKRERETRRLSFPSVLFKAIKSLICQASKTGVLKSLHISSSHLHHICQQVLPFFPLIMPLRYMFHHPSFHCHSMTLCLHCCSCLLSSPPSSISLPPNYLWKYDQNIILLLIF